MLLLISGLHLVVQDVSVKQAADVNARKKTETLKKAMVKTLSKHVCQR